LKIHNLKNNIEKTVASQTKSFLCLPSDLSIT
jgi:hypothetical protein